MSLSVLYLYYYNITVSCRLFLLTDQVKGVLKASELGYGGKETILLT